MKKSFILIVAFGLIAIMTGCGNGSSSASSSGASNVGTTTTEAVFDTKPQESVANATYVTSARGDTPPAPPSSSLKNAQEDADSNL